MHLYPETNEFLQMKASLAKYLIRGFVYTYFDKAMCRIILLPKTSLQSSTGVWVCDFDLPCFTVQFLGLPFVQFQAGWFSQTIILCNITTLQENKPHYVVGNRESNRQFWEQTECGGGREGWIKIHMSTELGTGGERQQRIWKCTNVRSGKRALMKFQDDCRGNIFEVGTKSYEGKPCLLILSFAFCWKK